MLFKIIILSIILIGIGVLALGIKLLIKKNAKLNSPTCMLEEDQQKEDTFCTKCRLKDLDKCPEKKDNEKKTNKLKKDQD